MRTTTITIAALAIGTSAIGLHHRRQRDLRAAHTAGYVLAITHVHRGLLAVPEGQQQQ